MNQPLQRRAYGRRRCSATLVEDLRAVAIPEYAAPPWVLRRAARVGRGDARAMLQCPGCKRWAMTLYDLDALAALSGPSAWGTGLRCRVCLRLRYRSQYQGRRPEAHPEARQALARSIQRATTPAARQRRRARLQVADAIVSERAARYVAHCEAIHTQRLTQLLARMARIGGIALSGAAGVEDAAEAGDILALHTYTRASPHRRSGDASHQSAGHQLQAGSAPRAQRPDFDNR